MLRRGYRGARAPPRALLNAHDHLLLRRNRLAPHARTAFFTGYLPFCVRRTLPLSLRSRRILLLLPCAALRSPACCLLLYLFSTMHGYCTVLSLRLLLYHAAHADDSAAGLKCSAFCALTARIRMNLAQRTFSASWQRAGHLRAWRPPPPSASPHSASFHSTAIRA